MCPAVWQQVGAPRADKDSVTDRYRSSLLSPVGSPPLDDPQLSLSSLSRASRLGFSRRLPGMQPAVASIDGYLSGPAGGELSQPAAECRIPATFCSRCLGWHRSRLFTRPRRSTDRRAGRALAAAASRDPVTRRSTAAVASSRPDVTRAARQAPRTHDRRDIGQIFSTICWPTLTATAVRYDSNTDAFLCDQSWSLLVQQTVCPSFCYSLSNSSQMNFRHSPCNYTTSCSVIIHLPCVFCFLETFRSSPAIVCNARSYTGV